LQLGQVSFRFLDESGEEMTLEQVEPLEQTLDLWTGIIYSKFRVANELVHVETACDSEQDALAVKVRSSLVQKKQLQVFIAFPAPDMTHTNWAKSIQLNWDHNDRHHTKYTQTSNESALFTRTMDSDVYEVRW